MKIVALLWTLSVCGCAAGQDDPLSVQQAPIATPTRDADADAGSCVCDFHWVTIAKPGDSPIRCYARGACEDVTCVPVLPLTEEPSCRFR